MSSSIAPFRLEVNQTGWKKVDVNALKVKIPTDWNTISIGDLCFSIGSGRTPKPEEYQSSGTPWLTISDISGGVINYNGAKKVDNSRTKIREAHPGDVLFSIYGSIGETLVADRICVTNQAILVLKPKFDGSFLKHALDFHAPQMKSAEARHGVQSNLSLGIVRNYSLAVPSSPEQQRIASVLSTQESRIEDLRAWSKTERQRLTWLTDELLSGRVRVVERQGGAETVVEVDENGVAKEALGAFELVANWEECKEIDINGKISKFPSAWMKQKISEHFEVSMGKTILSKDISKFDGDNLIPVFSATEDKKIFGYINRETLSASDLLDDGDIVIGARGTLGKPKLMTGPSTSTQTTIQCKSKNTLCSSLVVIIGKIDTSWFSTSGSGVPMLTAATVKNIEMALPSPPEQQRIAAVLSAQERQIEDIERLIAVEQKRLAWLTEELLSGRIRVEACND